MEKFNTGSKDLGFNKVQTLGEAKDKLNELKIPFIAVVVNRFKSIYYGVEQIDLGIHEYFIDEFGNELGYYTPIMKSLMIFDTPRKVGIKQDLMYLK